MTAATPPSDGRPFDRPPVHGGVSIDARALERTAVAILHDRLGVEAAAIRVTLADDNGGLAISAVAPVVIDPLGTPRGEDDTLLSTLQETRHHVVERMSELTGRRVTRVDLRITGSLLRSSPRLAPRERRRVR